LTVSTAEIQVGDVLRDGRYEVQEFWRRTPDKRIYLGYDGMLDFPVVIDVFSNNNLIMPSGLTLTAWEARVLGRLGDHPNIAKVVDYWPDGEAAVMVTRYLSGGSLLGRLAQLRDSGQDMSAEDIWRISMEIARALAHIHGRRILYRDQQPRNVLFDEWGTVHLVDFDTAVSLDNRTMSDLSHRTVIEYMAPELTDGADADERADLYSLGATMYEMAAGRPPYAGTREEILAARRAGPPIPIERDDLPAALLDLIVRLLAFDREQRPASATEVVEDLQDVCAARADIQRLLASDESATLEFKSSLRVPVDPPKPTDKRSPKEIERALEREVMDTLAAFFNTDGGTLIVGVAPDGTVSGIEVDYPRTGASRDDWRLTFDSLVSRDLGTEVMCCIHLRLEPWQGRTIAIIECSQRGEPTWVKDELFVRRMASTVKLSTPQAVAWCREHWG
jgi:serine/threonine protein kinase